MAKIVLITGGSASGKTHLSNIIGEEFGSGSIVISQDAFYKATSNVNTNYDIPEAFDWETLKTFVDDVKNNKKARLPIYDYISHSVTGYKDIEPQNVVIIEGLFAFFNKDIKNLADFAIYVDTPADIRLGRRIKRDVNERGRKVEDVINRWNLDVQPSFEKYISNKKREADVIIPWSSINNRSLRTILLILKNLEDVNV